MLIITGFVFIIIIVTFFMLKKNNTNKNNIHEKYNLNSEYHKKQTPSYLVYFDIDDTLTNANPIELNKIIKFLTEEKNCKIGIITASQRTIEHVCIGDEPNEYFDWVPRNLCVSLNKSNFDTFNSHVIEAGKKTVPYSNWDFGFKKGTQMKIGQLQHNICPTKIYLFDDNFSVLQDAKRIMPLSNFFMVDNNCEYLGLTFDRIKKIFI